MNARVLGALRVLRQVADRPDPTRPLGVGEIAEGLSAQLGSVSRWCSELERLDLLARGPGYGTVVLGPAAVRLSGRAAAPHARLVRRVLTRAAQQTGESVCLAAGSPEGGVRSIGAVGSAWTLHAPADVGYRFDHTSAVVSATRGDVELHESTVGRIVDVAAPVLEGGSVVAVVAARVPVNRRRGLPRVRTALGAARRTLQGALDRGPEQERERPGPLSDPATASALEAALAVLRHLAAGADDVAGVARGTGLRPDRTTRLLQACTAAGVVVERPVEAGEPVLHDLDWSVHGWYRAATGPLLESRGGPLVAAAALTTGACGFLTVLHGTRSLTVVEELTPAEEGLVMTPWLGRPHPVVGSDGGAVLVLDLGVEEVVELLGPRHTRSEIDALTARVGRLSRDGVLSVESPEDGGLSSFSAPVHDAAGAVAAAACLVGPLDWARPRTDDLRRATRSLAQQVSAQLF